jgi:hypothetical protein
MALYPNSLTVFSLNPSLPAPASFPANDTEGCLFALMGGNQRVILVNLL